MLIVPKVFDISPLRAVYAVIHIMENKPAISEYSIAVAPFLHDLSFSNIPNYII